MRGRQRRGGGSFGGSVVGEGLPAVGLVRRVTGVREGAHVPSGAISCFVPSERQLGERKFGESLCACFGIGDAGKRMSSALGQRSHWMRLFIDLPTFSRGCMHRVVLAVNNVGTVKNRYPKSQVTQNPLETKQP